MTPQGSQGVFGPKAQYARSLRLSWVSVSVGFKILCNTELPEAKVTDAASPAYSLAEEYEITHIFVYLFRVVLAPAPTAHFG